MLHVCLVTDTNYLHYTMMCIYDIMIRQDSNTEITFHIITDRLTEEETNNLTRMAGLRNTTLDIIPCDSTTIVINGNRRDPQLSGASFLRVLIPDLLKDKHIDRALYIDGDMLCRRDITDLFSMDLKGKPLGLVRDSVYLAFSDYRTVPWRNSDTNAGLILMDIPALVNMNFTEKMTKAINDTSCGIQELIDHEMHKNYMTLLPPICQIPMHNFVVNKFNPDQFCQLDQWNLYHGTNYESFQEIFDQTYFWHFDDNKDYYTTRSIVKLIYNTCEERLTNYLNTNTQMSWQKSDDEVFENVCYAAVDTIVARNRAIREQAAEDYRRRINAAEPDVIAWSQYFDRIYCLHSLDKPNRLGAVYHEMRRVSMEKTCDLRYYRTQETRFDISVYNDCLHNLFDDTISPEDRQHKTNQVIGYYNLFRELIGVGVNRVLVCEDDVLFLKDCIEIHDIMDHMPDLWDYIKFERVNGPNDIIQYRSSISPRDYFHRNYTGGYLGSACTAYSLAAMQLFVQIIEEQLLRPDYVLENRNDSRLDSLRRYVCAKNLVIQAGRSVDPSYTNIADPNDYWPDTEYRSLAKGGPI